MCVCVRACRYVCVLHHFTYTRPCSAHPPPPPQASEIVGGFMRGSKLWPYDDMVAGTAKVLDILERTLANINNEATGDWANSIRFACVCGLFQEEGLIYTATLISFKP